MRGPAFQPGELAATGAPARRRPYERFDAIALGVMRELWDRFPEALAPIQLGVEEVPMLPQGWSPEAVPLASFAAAQGGEPARVILLRKPIEHRARNRDDLEALIFTVLVEQVAEVLGVEPEEVHPEYRDRD
jgi:hypothetical protein